MPIACVNRVNGKVNDGEEVLINDSTMGVECARARAPHTHTQTHCESFVLQSAERRSTPTQFNLPKYIHYRRQFLFLRMLPRLIDNEQPPRATSSLPFLAPKLITVSRRNMNPVS